MSEYSFFGAVEKSFDKAARFTQWDPGLLEQIKQCNAVYRMHFPVKINDKIEVIKALRTMTDLGLHETKDLVERAPVQIRLDMLHHETRETDIRGNTATVINRYTLSEAADLLRKAGATVKE